MNIGRKIFYDKITGDTIVDTGQWENVNISKTVDQQISTYSDLSERNRDTFDVLELPFGAYSQDFAECNGYRVNVETKELEFSHPDPNTPEAPQVFEKPLTIQITELKSQLESTKEVLDFLLMGGM